MRCVPTSSGVNSIRYTPGLSATSRTLAVTGRLDGAVTVTLTCNDVYFTYIFIESSYKIHKTSAVLSITNTCCK